jgi:hypothetical protein
MKRTHLLLAVTVLVAAVLAQASVGPPPMYDTPPDWAGAERTTYNGWDFLQETHPGVPIPPDYGDGSGEIIFADFGFWQPEMDGLEGVIEDPFHMEIEIANFPEPLPEKRIWLQLNWGVLPGIPVPPEPDFWVEAFGYSPFGHSQAIGEHLWTEEIGAGQFFWYHSVYEIVLEPNPEFETIFIDFHTPLPPLMLDSIIIDTICQVPEPATLSLLALGGLLLRRRK